MPRKKGRDHAAEHRRADGALERDLGIDKCRLGRVALGDFLVNRGLVRFALDREQELALLDRVTVGEFARAEKAFDPGAQLDFVDGRSAADELQLCGERLQFGRLDQDGRRRSRLLRPRSARRYRLQ